MRKPRKGTLQMSGVAYHKQQPDLVSSSIGHTSIQNSPSYLCCDLQLNIINVPDRFLLVDLWSRTVHIAIKNNIWCHSFEWVALNGSLKQASKTCLRSTFSNSELSGADNSIHEDYARIIQQQQAWLLLLGTNGQFHLHPMRTKDSELEITPQKPLSPDPEPTYMYCSW